MPRFIDRTLALAAASAQLLLATCANPTDICTPQRATYGFFSKGDCILSRSSYFQGHEWLTVLGNRDLAPADRFTTEQIEAIAEGNRRVDWPKELLVHLNVSVPAYVDALVEYTDQPDVQRHHFLLTDKNESREAAGESYRTIHELSRDAARDWVTNRTRALTLVGKACHVLQDSFSEAHTFRDRGHAERPFCIVRVKAFIPRAKGFESYADGTRVLFHGGEVDEEGNGVTADSIGHTTTKDSLYREARECRGPEIESEVEACLNEAATNARRATRDYLSVMSEVLRAGASGGELDELTRASVQAVIDTHLSLCPDAP